MNDITKRKTKHVIMFLIVLFGSIVFTGCDKDKDKEEDSFNLSNVLQSSKWVSTGASLGEGDNLHLWLDKENYTLYFLSSSTGLGYFVQRSYDTYLGYNKVTNSETFTYSTSGNRLSLDYSDGRSLTLTYREGYLLQNGTPVFKEYSMSSGDYEIIEKNKPKTGNCGTNLKYAYDSQEKKLTISGSGDMYDYSSNNQPWKDLQINEVFIGSGCTYIGRNAFGNQKYSLSEITIPASVTEIADMAFYGTDITEVWLASKNLKRIGKNAFATCSYLKKAVFDNSALETIDDDAFAGCPIGMGYFDMEDKMPNLKYLGSRAFNNATFSSLTLNEKLEEIGDEAFSFTSEKLNATKIVIPNSVTTIGDCAFNGSFSEVRIGTGVKTIGNRAFITSKSGSMYVNIGSPLTDIGSIIIAGSTNWESKESSWYLYVPKGSKLAYQNANVWKKFKTISEDGSLDNTTGEKIQAYKECPDNHHPHIIDLGLPSGTKWACCNVGASTPEGYGGYYAWGETNEKNDYSEDTYTYYNKKTGTYTSLGKDIAGTDYDVAHVKCGGNWKMPTSAQIKELVDKCTWTSDFKEINGIKGCVVTGPNGGSIFLPVAGYRDYSYLESVKSEGFYLSSTLDSDGDNGAYFLFLDLTSRYVDTYYRYNGYSVRPVTGH